MAFGSNKYRGKTALRWYKKGSYSFIRPTRVSRVKMQKPTARNQQKQIIKNSKAISAMVKAYHRNMVYTDYQLASSDALNRNAWVNVPLTNVEFWQPVMRRSIAIQNTKMTTCVKMDLNVRYDTGQFIKASVYWNVFLVRPRSQGAGQITTPLILNLDYTEQTGYAGRRIKLNPGKFDVIYDAANDIITPLGTGLSRTGLSRIGLGRPLA